MDDSRLSSLPPDLPQESDASSASPPMHPTPVPCSDAKLKSIEDQMLHAFIKMLDDLRKERQQNEDNEDYEQIFPEDTYGEETGPNARVFRVYNEVAAAYDADMVGKLTESCDLLLIFAGLFSAVVATFVVQTSQALQTDNGVVSNSLLSEIVQLLRAQHNGTSLGSIAPAITETTPSNSDVWVNGLWFTSLALSLTAALLSVLAKQWLRHYMSPPSGTIRDRSLTRQFRFAGLEKWSIPDLIGHISPMLFSAMCIFLAGLVVFLIPRCRPLAYVIGVKVVCMYCMYNFTLVDGPASDVQCPFRTPASEFFNSMSHKSRKAIVTVLNTMIYPPLVSPPYESLRDKERNHLIQKSGGLSLDAIKWLLDASSNPSVHSVAFQALGGLPPSQLGDGKTRCLTIYSNLALTLVNDCLVVSNEAGRVSVRPGFSGRLERHARAWPLIHPSDRLDLSKECDLSDLFRDLDFIEGIMSAIPCCLDQGNPQLDVFDLIIQLMREASSGIALSPATWLNLFQEISRRGPPLEFKFAICAKVVENLNPLGATWDNETTPMTITEALSRGPQLVLRIVQEHDIFEGQATSTWDFVPPPNSHLRALLAVYRSLTENGQVLPPHMDTFKSLFYSTSRHIRFALQHGDSDSSEDGYLAAFYVLSRSLSETALLTGHGWMGSDVMSRYFHVTLNLCCCSIALFAASGGLSSRLQVAGDWKVFLERVAAIVFPDADAILGEHFVSHTRMTARILWCMALEHDIGDAYTIFINVHVLGTSRRDYDSAMLVEAVVSGITRQLQSKTLTVRRQPDSKFTDCMRYIHEADNLFATCQILTDKARPPISVTEDILVLARLQPDNESWGPCLERLRQQTDPSVVDALAALQEFFEDRRRDRNLSRRFNPVVYIGRIIRSTSDQRPPDLEMNTCENATLPSPGTAHCQTSTASKLDQTARDDVDGDLALVSQPPNETGDRLSSKGSELAEDESSSSHRTMTEPAPEHSFLNVGQNEPDQRGRQRVGRGY